VGKGQSFNKLDSGATRIDTPCFPSPRPSPLGRGSACSHGLAAANSSHRPCVLVGRGQRQPSGSDGANNRTSVPPLPKGEGRGEGEQGVQLCLVLRSGPHKCSPTRAIQPLKITGQSLGARERRSSTGRTSQQFQKRADGQENL
jgi:hypothetical protein